MYFYGDAPNWSFILLGRLAEPIGQLTPFDVLFSPVDSINVPLYENNAPVIKPFHVLQISCYSK